MKNKIFTQMFRIKVAGFLVVLSFISSSLRRENLALAADPAKSAQASSSEGAADANPGGGDLYCEVDVYFKWRRDPEPKTTVDENGRKVPVPVEPALLEPINEFYTRVGESGTSENDVKDMLAARIPKIELQARRTCEELRQSVASCVGKKLKMAQPDYQLLDFQSRQELRNSIEQDCTDNKGLCLGTSSSPITCFRSAPPKGTAEGAGGASEKDAGKAKAKK